MELKKNWLRKAVKRTKSDRSELPGWMKPEPSSPTARFKHGRSSKVGYVAASVEVKAGSAHKISSSSAATSKASKTLANTKTTKTHKRATASSSRNKKGQKS